jgi:signal transduction histidine kinase
VAVFCQCEEGAASAAREDVLGIYAAARDAPVVAVGDREMRRVLGAGLSEIVDFYSECIDQSRYEQGDDHVAFRNSLARKFQGHRFDMVVAMDHRALEFVTRTREEEPSVWERYRGYAFSAVALLLTQTLLIGALLIQRARRLRAESAVLGSATKLNKSYDRIRDLGVRLLAAQETERARVARELHDDIGQQVSLLAIELDMLAGSLPTPFDGAARDVAARAQDVARSVHDLSHRLHPVRLRLIGLAALDGLPREFESSGIGIHVTHENVPPGLPADLALCLFRIAEEAVRNAVRYSGATHVRVRVSGGTDHLVLTITDDGVGFDVDEAWGRGLGLISIAERAEVYRGVFSIQSSPGAGTRIDVTLPAPVTVSPVPIPQSGEEERQVS